MNSLTFHPRWGDKRITVSVRLDAARDSPGKVQHLKEKCHSCPSCILTLDCNFSSTGSFSGQSLFFAFSFLFLTEDKRRNVIDGNWWLVLQNIEQNLAESESVLQFDSPIFFFFSRRDPHYFRLCPQLLDSISKSFLFRVSCCRIVRDSMRWYSWKCPAWGLAK